MIAPVADAERQPPQDGAARIERALRASSDGSTMSELVAATGLHENTIRRALARLEERGAVHVEAERRASRGRPTLRYRHAGSLHESYRQFLPLLLDLVDVAPGTDDDAYAIGHRHGVAASTLRSGGACDAVVNSLAALRFAPRRQERGADGASAIVLSGCPFTEAVASSPGGRRICVLHHGLVAGIAESSGGALRSFTINDPRVAPCELTVVDAAGASEG